MKAECFQCNKIYLYTPIYLRTNILRPREVKALVSKQKKKNEHFINRKVNICKFVKFSRRITACIYIYIYYTMIVPIRISNALLVTINWAIVTLMTLRLSTLTATLHAVWTEVYHYYHHSRFS